MDDANSPVCEGEEALALPADQIESNEQEEEQQRPVLSPCSTPPPVRRKLEVHFVAESNDEEEEGAPFETEDTGAEEKKSAMQEGGKADAKKDPPPPVAGEAEVTQLRSTQHNGAVGPTTTDPTFVFGSQLVSTGDTTAPSESTSKPKCLPVSQGTFKPCLPVCPTPLRSALWWTLIVEASQRKVIHIWTHCPKEVLHLQQVFLYRLRAARLHWDRLGASCPNAEEQHADSSMIGREGRGEGKAKGKRRWTGLTIYRLRKWLEHSVSRCRDKALDDCGDTLRSHTMSTCEPPVPRTGDIYDALVASRKNETSYGARATLKRGQRRRSRIDSSVGADVAAAPQEPLTMSDKTRLQHVDLDALETKIFNSPKRSRMAMSSYQRQGAALVVNPLRLHLTHPKRFRLRDNEILTTLLRTELWVPLFHFAEHLRLKEEMKRKSDRREEKSESNASPVNLQPRRPRLVASPPSQANRRPSSSVGPPSSTPSPSPRRRQSLAMQLLQQRATASDAQLASSHEAQQKKEEDHDRRLKKFVMSKELFRRMQQQLHIVLFANEPPIHVLDAEYRYYRKFSSAESIGMGSTGLASQLASHLFGSGARSTAAVEAEDEGKTGGGGDEHRHGVTWFGFLEYWLSVGDFLCQTAAVGEYAALFDHLLPFVYHCLTTRRVSCATTKKEEGGAKQEEEEDGGSEERTPDRAERSKPPWKPPSLFPQREIEKEAQKLAALFAPAGGSGNEKDGKATKPSLQPQTRFKDALSTPRQLCQWKKEVRRDSEETTAAEHKPTSPETLPNDSLANLSLGYPVALALPPTDADYPQLHSPPSVAIHRPLPPRPPSHPRQPTSVVAAAEELLEKAYRFAEEEPPNEEEPPPTTSSTGTASSLPAQGEEGSNSAATASLSPFPTTSSPLAVLGATSNSAETRSRSVSFDGGGEVFESTSFGFSASQFFPPELHQQTAAVEQRAQGETLARRTAALLRRHSVGTTLQKLTQQPVAGEQRGESTASSNLGSSSRVLGSPGAAVRLGASSFSPTLHGNEEVGNKRDGRVPVQQQPTLPETCVTVECCLTSDATDLAGTGSERGTGGVAAPKKSKQRQRVTWGSAGGGSITRRWHPGPNSAGSPAGTRNNKNNNDNAAGTLPH